MNYPEYGGGVKDYVEWIVVFFLVVGVGVAGHFVFDAFFPVVDSADAVCSQLLGNATTGSVTLFRDDSMQAVRLSCVTPGVVLNGSGLNSSQNEQLNPAGHSFFAFLDMRQLEPVCIRQSGSQDCVEMLQRVHKPSEVG